jgi:hypothetical protein
MIVLLSFAFFVLSHQKGKHAWQNDHRYDRHGNEKKAKP